MNVHLVRDPELNMETFSNILNILQQYSGPIRFISGESEDEVHEHFTRTWQSEEEFQKQQVVQASRMAEAYMIFPMEEKYHSWEYFFGKCKDYRQRNSIRQRDPVGLYDHVFYLTDLGNDMNWFGSVGPSMKDYFIQTSGWSMFFGEEVDERFPVAYEVAVWLIRHLMFEQREEILDAVHKTPRGCGNDFCENKQDIILKMRTADLCPECMKLLQSRDASPLIVNQLFDIMDGIRKNMTFRERAKLIRKPSRMEIRGHMKKIFLTDLGDLELRFNPKERSIYLFYLNHPEGIHLTELNDHREEIAGYYGRFTNQFDKEEIEESINRLLDPLDNNINVVLSRIKRKLRDAVGEELLPFYIIDGEHGGEKRIALDWEYITYIA